MKLKREVCVTNNKSLYSTSPGVTICRSDKIALFLVINLLNLECIAERASFFFFNNGLRFFAAQKRFILRELLIYRKQRRIDISAERTEIKRDSSGTISFYATLSLCQRKMSLPAESKVPHYFASITGLAFAKHLGQHACPLQNQNIKGS
ncbi:Uncharacterized protein DBV15_10773 [Temnothorax longispinosus]|uniref:Uncharacterized protein n=1 Tax=Temnothorax longispinosus TaxID=300112 RepID=A0A4S2KL48_9HYME|nr:Uncharacterized protein DBV15_10773 [Temnothorax longispinosus]